MTRASFRSLRTGLIGSVILGLAAGGHLAGGGRLPEPAILAALCALTVLPVAALTKFQLPTPVLAGLLGAGQVWLHWAFHALSEGIPSRAAVPPGESGHVHAALSFQAVSSGTSGAGAAGSAWVMFAAHAVASLATAVVLARGEQALSALAAWLRPLVQLPSAVPIQPSRLPGAVFAPVIVPAVRAGRRLPFRRGPPAAMPAA
jgi:hypothetical protein